MRRIKLIVAYDGTKLLWMAGAAKRHYSTGSIKPGSFRSFCEEKRPASAQAGPTQGYMPLAMWRCLTRMRECRQTASHLR